MPQFKCPQCATVISAQPGAEAHCLNCGFRAMVPEGGGPLVAAPPAAGSPTPAPPATPLGPGGPAPPQGEVMPLAKSTAAWGFLLSMVGLGTFFLAAYGLPFLLGLGGVALGLVAFFKNKQDRRGLIASVIGGVAILAALLFLVL